MSQVPVLIHNFLNEHWAGTISAQLNNHYAKDGKDATFYVEKVGEENYRLLVKGRDVANNLFKISYWCGYFHGQLMSHKL